SGRAHVEMKHAVLPRLLAHLVRPALRVVEPLPSGEVVLLRELVVECGGAGGLSGCRRGNECAEKEQYGEERLHRLESVRWRGGWKASGIRVERQGRVENDRV